MCVVFFIKKTVFFVSATIFLTQCQKLGWDFLKIFLNFYLCIFFNANNNTNKNTLNNNNKRQFLTYIFLRFWRFEAHFLIKIILIKEERVFDRYVYLRCVAISKKLLQSYIWVVPSLF